MTTVDLVFEGGGAKGMVFVGALEELLRSGQYQPGRLMGTSAGAITATILAAGYTPTEMLEALAEHDDLGQSVFSAFLGVPEPLTREAVQDSAIRHLLKRLDIPLLPEALEDRLDSWLVEQLAGLPSARHLFSFVDRGGWFAADAFVTWMARRLNTGSFRGQPRAFGAMTFEEFYAATGAELTLVTSDTTWSRMLLLNHRTAPKCPVVWGTRMSMSIPLLWQEVIWQPEWGPYYSWDAASRSLNPKDIAGHCLVDGGMLSNFPLALFMSTMSDVAAVLGAERGDEIVGLLIDEALRVPHCPDFPPASFLLQTLGALTTVQRLERLVSTAIGANDNFAIALFARHVVRLPAGGYGTTQFNLTDAERQPLVDAGREPMLAYLARRAEEAELGAPKDLGAPNLVALANLAAASMLP